MQIGLHLFLSKKIVFYTKLNMQYSSDFCCLVFQKKITLTTNVFQQNVWDSAILISNNQTDTVKETARISLNNLWALWKINEL
jgi:hypothetical protein